MYNNEDMKAYNMSCKSLLKAQFTAHCYRLVRLYRRGNWYYRHGIKLLPELVKKKMLRNYACEISPYAQIGKRLLIHHSVGIVIGHEVIIGDDCEIFQNVTIGSNRKERNGRMMPIIGNHVSVGSGAVIVGGITIGSHVKIGANTYVDKDVPDNATVIGTSVKILND